MKLFSKEQPAPVTLSLEKFVEYYGTASVVSTEAITDYFFKLKDSLNTVTSKVLSLNDDRLVTEVLSSRFEVENKVKRLKYTNLRPHRVSIPENFKGRYTDYMKDLIETSTVLVPGVENTLGSLKMTISAFMNEFSEDKLDNLFAKSVYEEAEKLTEVHSKQISKYFPKKNNAVKAELGNVIKSLDDVPKLYKMVSELEKLINPTKLKEITRLTNDVAELVDLVIEQNNKTGILVKSNYLKKDLISAIHVVAKEVELVGFVYANVMFLYTALDSLTRTLVAVDE